MTNKSRLTRRFRVAFVIAGVFGIVAVSALMAIFSITGAAELQRLRNEIRRVADTSGVQPIASSCRNAEFVDICFADYNIPTDETKKMLSRAGYTVDYNEPAMYPSQKRIVFKNKQESMRADIIGDLNGRTTALMYMGINTTY